jgi:hypothetical protein
VAIAALFIRDPSAAVLLTAILIQPLIAHTHPPPIAEDQLADASWRNQAEATRKLTALMQRKFPTGSSEGALKSTLQNQGFKPLPPPPVDCLPPGQPPPVGRVFTPCPTYDRRKTLEYGWGSGVCGQTITVRWSTDDRDNVTRVDASYYMACL